MLFTPTNFDLLLKVNVGGIQKIYRVSSAKELKGIVVLDQMHLTPFLRRNDENCSVREIVIHKNVLSKNKAPTTQIP